MPSVLLDCEEALNQGSMTAAEVFISLRSKSILHLFACIGRFLGLEVNVVLLSLFFPSCFFCFLIFYLKYKYLKESGLYGTTF